MKFCRLINSIVSNQKVGVFLLMSLMFLLAGCGDDDVLGDCYAVEYLKTDAIRKFNIHKNYVGTIGVLLEPLYGLSHRAQCRHYAA